MAQNETRMGQSYRDKIPPAATNSNSPSYASEIILPNRATLPNRVRVYRRTDGRTDWQGDSSIPPLTSLWGYNNFANISTLMCSHFILTFHHYLQVCTLVQSVVLVLTRTCIVTPVLPSVTCMVLLVLIQTVSCVKCVNINTVESFFFEGLKFRGFQVSDKLVGISFCGFSIKPAKCIRK